jgi:serine phosphatase RsbU (regulator of sigma subunit)
MKPSFLTSMAGQTLIILVALFASTATTTYLGFSNMKAQLVESVQAQSAMIAENIAPAIQFSDTQTASDMLRSLGSNKDITAVLLLDSDQKPIVAWSADGRNTDDINKRLFLSHNLNELHTVYQPIVIGIVPKGMLITEYSLSSVYSRVAMFTAGTLLAIILVFLTAFFLYRRIDAVQRKRQEIEVIHNHTKDSIAYASLIQKALMPEESQFQQFFGEHLIVWHPKDVVGGDVYSLIRLRHEDEALLMVIDCTGHGVPGAFVSMLVKAVEQEIMTRIQHSNEPISPAALLAEFNRTLKRVLKQDEHDSQHNAGFDGAIVYINRAQRLVRYAGANTPLFVCQSDRVDILKGDRHSIGYHRSKADYVFTDHDIICDDKTRFYLATDGLLDQIGGEQAIMFGKKRFSALLSAISHLAMDDQSASIVSTVSDYRGLETQNDDITVVGFKVS